MSAITATQLFLWVGQRGRDDAPGLVEVTVCHLCLAIVPLRRLDEHEDWHHERDRR